MNLNELVISAQNGDNSAIERLYQIYYKELFTAAKTMIGDEHEAEDIAQDVFIYAMQKLNTLRSPAAFHSWIRRMVVNKCLNFKRDKHDIISDSEDKNIVEVTSTTESGDFTKFLPHATLDKAETQKMILGIVMNLSEKHKNVVFMHYYSGMSIEEISNELNVKPGTVKSRLSYARNEIKQKILAYEKQGIKLYHLDAEESLPDIITSVSETIKPMQNMRFITQNLPSPHVINSAASGITNITASGLSHTLGYSLSAKLSVGISAAILTATFFVMPFIQSDNANKKVITIPETSEIIQMPGQPSVPDTSEPDTENSSAGESVRYIYLNNNTQSPPEVREIWHDNTIYVPGDTQFIEASGSRGNSGITEDTQYSRPDYNNMQYVQTPTDIQYGLLPAESPDVITAVSEQPVVDYTPDAVNNVPDSVESTPVNRSTSHYVTTDSGYTFKVYDDTNEAMLVSYSGNQTELVIPEHITEQWSNGTTNTVAITSVIKGNSPFRNNTTLTSVTLPASMHYIPSNLFYNCGSLKEVKASQYVTEIGSDAFYGCKELETVSPLPNLEMIGESAFENCTSLSSFTFGNQLENIEKRAFRNSGLKNAVMPDSLIFLGDYAFFNTPVETASLSSSIMFLGQSVFANCDLKTFTINLTPEISSNDQITGKIRSDYIASLNKMFGPDVDYLNSSEIIEYDDNEEYQYLSPETLIIDVGDEPAAFDLSNFHFLRYDKNLIIEGNVSKIIGGSYMPREQWLLTGNVILPDGLQKIDDDAFMNQFRLKSVILPPSLTEIGKSAFSGCTGLESVTFFDNLEKIDINAFQGCTSLTSITLPESIRYIGANAFDNCSSLENIDCLSEQAHFDPYAFTNTKWYSDQPEGELYLNGIYYTTKSPDDKSLVVKNDNIWYMDELNNDPAMGIDTEELENRSLIFDSSFDILRITNNVTSIPDEFFKRYPTVKIEIDPDNPNFKNKDNVIYTSDMTRIISCQLPETTSEFTVPEEVTEIAPQAFAGYQDLKIKWKFFTLSYDNTDNNWYVYNPYNNEEKRPYTSRSENGFIIYDNDIFFPDPRIPENKPNNDPIKDSTDYDKEFNWNDSYEWYKG